MPTVPAARHRAPFLRLFGRRRPDVVAALQTSAATAKQASAAIATVTPALEKANTALSRAAAAAGDAAPHVRPVPTEDNADMPDREPYQPEPDCETLPAVRDSHPGPFEPGPYLVTFGRLPHAVWPKDLTGVYGNPAELAAAVATHVRPYTADPDTLTVTVDRAAKGGTIRTGDRTLATFTYKPTGENAA